MEEKICHVEVTIEKEGDDENINSSENNEIIPNAQIKIEPPDEPDMLGMLNILMKGEIFFYLAKQINTKVLYNANFYIWLRTMPS